MAHPTAVILAVGLTRDVIGPHTPHLQSLVAESDVEEAGFFRRIWLALKSLVGLG